MARGLAPCILACVVSIANAGELVPYQLPAPRPASAAQATVAKGKAPAEQVAARVVPESTYQRFQTQVRTLSKAEREGLRTSFAKARDAAVKAGDSSRAVYYFRLLDILDKTPGNQQ